MNELQAAFEAKQVEIAKLEQELRDLPLPDFFESPTCCKNRAEALMVVESGYWRADRVSGWSEPTEEKRWVHAYTDGWDSMSESGVVSYLECGRYRGGCGAMYALPDEVEWD